MSRYRSNYQHYEEHFKNDNVYHLITLLCENLYNDVGKNGRNNANSYNLVHQCRCMAYEILLKKKKVQYDDNLSLDPLSVLERLEFSLILNATTVYAKKRANDVGKCIQNMIDWNILENDENKAILTFLLSLKNTSKDNDSNNVMGSGSINYPMAQLTKSPYPIFSNHIFKMPNPMSIYSDKGCIEYTPYNEIFLKYSNNIHYTEYSNPMHHFTNTLESTVQKYSTILNKTPESQSIMTTFTDILDEIEDAENLTIYKNRKYHSNSTTLELEWNVLPKESSNFTPNPTNKIARNRSTIYVRNFDNLSGNRVEKENSFITEIDSVHHVSSLLTVKRSNWLILSYEEFISDVKNLTISIPTDTFFVNDAIIFEMRPNIAVRGISQQTLGSVVDEFLEIGTCYKRLTIMITENPCNLKLLFDGFVFKVLCKCIQKFLFLFRKFVTSHEDKSLLTFSKRIEIFKMQLITITKISFIHPNDICDYTLPTGSNFLKYLYDKMNDVYEDESKKFLIHILVNCCNAYYSKFEKWLFNGYLDDPSNELFIRYVDHYRFNTKYFFDKAYLICDEIVPEFLRGYEEDILLCGKYTMLLKSFKPTHPLFSLECPKLRTCLSFNIINELKKECEEYKKKGQQVCGKMVSIREVFKEEERQRNIIIETIAANTKLKMSLWKAEVEAKLIKINKEKREKLEILREQIALANSNAINARKNNIKIELNHIIESIDKDNNELMIENLECEQKIVDYIELNRIIDEQQEKLSTVINGLKMCENGNILSDNADEKLDENVEDLPEKTKLAEIEKDNSDVANANVNTTENVLSELEKNKLKCMTSNFTSDEHNKTRMEKCKLLTELDRNRNRMMNCDINKNFEEYEFGITAEVKKPSDLEINRNKNMAHHFSTDISDLKKNRQKVMQIEYGYENNNYSNYKPTMTLNVQNSYKKQESTTEVEEEQSNMVLTPMSVDSELSSIAEGDMALEVPENTDLLTPSPRKVKGKANLKLRTELPSSDFNSKRFGVPETAILNLETPISALNDTKLISNKSGFDFTVGSEQTVPAPVVINELCDENALSLSFCTYQNDPVYIDFKQSLFINRNAEFFALNIPTDSEIASEKKDSADLNNLDMPTLARYLQLSIAFPLEAHMELVNGEILKLFIEELDILGHFKCLREYFFHMNGEFGNYICEGFYKKLASNVKPSELLNFHSLHNILDNALESSISGNVGKYANRLSFIVDNVPESFDYKSPTVLDMLSLSYHVDWPLNLILNPETLKQYSRIFNYLLKVKRLSWLLEESFGVLKNLYKTHGKNILASSDYRHIQHIRHKLVHFVSALQNHIINNIQIGWKMFKDDLETAQTMDHLYRKHTNYIKRIIFLCMMNKKSVKFYNTIEDIFKIILRFCTKLTAMEWLKSDNGHILHPLMNKLKVIESDFDNLLQYTVYSGNKIVLTGYQREIGDFIHLININGYYTPKRS